MPLPMSSRLALVSTGAAHQCECGMVEAIHPALLGTQLQADAWALIHR